VSLKSLRYVAGYVPGVDEDVGPARYVGQVVDLSVPWGPRPRHRIDTGWDTTHLTLVVLPWQLQRVGDSVPVMEQDPRRALVSRCVADEVQVHASWARPQGYVKLRSNWPCSTRT